jgi:putative FmdB family regulatory protein
LEDFVPTYQYACTECGDQLEVVQRFSDDPLAVCGACGGKLRKVFSPVGIVFKGSGFYRTDSRSGSVSSGASGNGKSGSDGSSSEGSSDSKSDSGSKAETKSSDSSSSSNGSETASKGSAGASTSSKVA